MRIAIGADHAGVTLKDQLKQWLIERGDAVEDVGTYTADSVDYPDFAAKVGHAVADGRAERGLLVCGSGIGMAMAANKVPGIRAAAVVDEASARLAREHNDANVLTLGARLTAVDEARELLRIFLVTEYQGGRHQLRIDKMRALDTRP